MKIPDSLKFPCKIKTKDGELDCTDVWWDGYDLCVETKDGQSIRFTDVVVQSCKYESSSPGISIEPITFVGKVEGE